MTNHDCKGLVADVFRLCNELSKMLDRPISPDGHLVGGLGEVFARDELDLILTKANTKDYDAVDDKNRKVQIKTTTRSSIALTGESPGAAQRVVVVRLDRIDGSAQLVYVGAAAPIWAMAPRPLKRRQWTKSIRMIAALAENELHRDGRAND